MSATTNSGTDSEADGGLPSIEREVPRIGSETVDRERGGNSYRVLRIVQRVRKGLSRLFVRLKLSVRYQQNQALVVHSLSTGGGGIGGQSRKGRQWKFQSQCRFHPEPISLKYIQRTQRGGLLRNVHLYYHAQEGSQYRNSQISQSRRFLPKLHRR